MEEYRTPEERSARALERIAVSIETLVVCVSILAGTAFVMATITVAK